MTKAEKAAADYKANKERIKAIQADYRATPEAKAYEYGVARRSGYINTG